MSFDDGPSFDGQAFHKLLQQLEREEARRDAISSNVKDLKTDLDGLIQGGKPGKAKLRRSASDVDDFKRHCAPCESQAPQGPMLRPCCCGCGELVFVGDSFEGDAAPLHIQQVETTLPPIDTKAQRASILRLAAKKPQKVVASDGEKPACQKSKQLDLSRLEAMAQPKKEVVPPPVEDYKPSINKYRPPPSAPLEPEFLEETNLDLESRRWKPRRSQVADANLPGLSRLLQRASIQEMTQHAGPAVKLTRSATTGAIREEFYPWPEAPAPMRTWKAQKGYVEDRLYKKPAPPESSVAGLQKRLEELQRARKEREMAALEAGSKAARVKRDPGYEGPNWSCILAL